MIRRKWLKTILVFSVLAFSLALPGLVGAQFGSPFVPQTTSSIVTGIISDAISSSIREVLNARPVVDREKVAAVNSMALGRTRSFAGMHGKTKLRALGEAIKIEGSRMVTALSDGSLGLWDMDNGRELKRLRGGHKGGVNAIAISEEAGLIVSAGAGGSSQVWKLSSGKKMARLEGGESGAAKAVLISTDGKLAITTYDDGSISLWKTGSGEEIRHFKAFRSSIQAAALRSNDTLVVAGSADGKISVWDVESGEKVLAFKAHKGKTRAIAPLANQEHFASTGDDGKIRLWDMETGDEIKSFGGGVPLHALAANHAGDKIAAGAANGKVLVYDINSGKIIKTLEGHTSAITALVFGEGDAVVHTAALDGTSRIFSLKKGEELVQIVSSENGWAAFNKKDGTFSGKGDGAEAVSWANDDVSINMDRFSESHLEPGLLAKAAKGEKTSLDGRPKLSVKFKMPPVVAFATPEEDATSDDDDYEITVQAGNLGGGVREIRIYQNGRLVASDMIESVDVEETVSRDFEVKLISGKNEFRVVALSDDLIESRPAKIKIKYTGAERKSTLHLATIGINLYRNPALNLNYGVPDAEGLQEFFNSQPLKLFKAVKLHALTDKAATKQAIKAMIKGLKDTEPQDVVIIYLAGHGDTVDGKWYFMPQEITYPERPDHVRAKGISSDELDGWVREVGAQKVVMLMDACKSGAAITATRGFEERKALSRLSRATGIHMVAAAGKDQFAAELAELGHGAFTYVLLEGLAGKADASGDKTVSIRELAFYLEDQLPELSEETAGVPQFPVISSVGQDFPLAVVN